jgi:hypothetical protein
MTLLVTSMVTHTFDGREYVIRNIAGSASIAKGILRIVVLDDGD